MGGRTRLGALLALLLPFAAAPAAGQVPPPKPFVLGGQEILPGTRAEVGLRASESFLSTDVLMTVGVVHGARRGRVLCMTAGIHGDELNGVQIVRETLERTTAEELYGTLLAVPIVNVFGFVNQTRYLPDRRDLNRHFPGRPGGSIASRLAYRLWRDVIRHCEVLLDFHTGAQNRANLAQIRADLRVPKLAALAVAFDAPVVIHNPGAPGTLRRAAVDAGVAALLYEAGQTLRFEREEVERGIAGARNVMIRMEMLDQRPTDIAPQKVFRETHWVRAAKGGILELFVALGERVESGQVIGAVSDPLRRTRGEAVSRWTGTVIGIERSPMVVPGMAVAHVGVDDGRIEASEAEEELGADRPE